MEIAESEGYFPAYLKGEKVCLIEKLVTVLFHARMEVEKAIGGVITTAQGEKKKSTSEWGYVLETH